MNENLGSGRDLIKLLSENFYSKKDMVFEELIINSLDSGASRIDINIDFDNKDNINRIEIVDNGSGVDLNKVKNLLFFANSTKSKDDLIDVKNSNLKRPIRGSFGLGKFSSRKICNNLVIETWTNSNEKFVLNLNYLEIEKLEDISKYDIDIIPIKNFKENSDSGTKLILTSIINLSKNEFFEDSYFEESILKRLSKFLPYDDETNIFINGDPLPQYNILQDNLFHISKNFKNPYYSFNEVFNGNNIISGKIYVYIDNIKKEQFGTFIKVKDRVVNRNDTLNILNLNTLSHDAFFHRRVKIFLNADFMEDEILANRMGFKESEISLRLKAFLEQKFQEIWKEMYILKNQRYVKYNSKWILIDEYNRLLDLKREEEKKEKKEKEKKEKEKKEKEEKINFNKLSIHLEKLNNVKKFESTFLDYKIEGNSEREKYFNLFIQNKDNFDDILDIYLNSNKKEILKDENFSSNLNDFLRFKKIQYYVDENNNIIREKTFSRLDFLNQSKLNSLKNDNLKTYLNTRNLSEIYRNNNYFEILINEINENIKSKRFTSSIILSRKLFESMIIKFFEKNNYPDLNYKEKRKKEFFYLTFDELIKSLENNKEDFKFPKFDEHVNYLKNFRVLANSSTHSIFYNCLLSDEFYSFKIN
ncbi:MAG: ATP-binding protein, partial [Nanoarchaeota archaeon]|nr:ATP-binding protein [Nanoarchaeota archaeon]